MSCIKGGICEYESCAKCKTGEYAESPSFSTKKWYYVWHAHSGDYSIFQTAEYEGRGGYETKKDAIQAVKTMLVKIQRETSLDLLELSQKVSYKSERLDEISRALLKLEKEV